MKGLMCVIMQPASPQLMENHLFNTEKIATPEAPDVSLQEPSEDLVEH